MTKVLPELEAAELLALGELPEVVTISKGDDGTKTGGLPELSPQRFSRIEVSLP